VKNVLGILISGELGWKSEGNIDGGCWGGRRNGVPFSRGIGISDLISHRGEFRVPLSLNKVICRRPASAEHAALCQRQSRDAYGSSGL